MSEPISKAKVSLVASLSMPKMRRRHGLFMAEGHKSVADTLGLFSPEFIVVSEESALPAGIPASVPVFTADAAAMRKMSTLSTPPRVIAVYRMPEPEDVPAPVAGELAVLLDGIQDPGNLGTIVRSAHWFGIRRIYCSKDTVDIFNSKTIQATMGSIGHVDVFYCDLADIIASRPDGMQVFGLLLEGENIYRQPLSQSGLIVLGNEGKGISPAIRGLVTGALTIPPGNPSSHSESLNVGVAAAVALSQFRSRI